MVFSFISTRLYLCTLSFRFVLHCLVCLDSPSPLFFQDPHFIRHSLLCSTPPCLLSLFPSSLSTPSTVSSICSSLSSLCLRLPCLFNLFITVFSVYAFHCLFHLLITVFALSTPSLSLLFVHHCLRSVYAFPVSSICSSLFSLCLRLRCLNLFITVFTATPSLSLLFVNHCLRCLRLPCLCYLFITVFALSTPSLYCLFYLFITVFALSMRSLSLLFVLHCLLCLRLPSHQFVHRCLFSVYAFPVSSLCSSLSSLPAPSPALSPLCSLVFSVSRHHALFFTNNNNKHLSSSSSPDEPYVLHSGK